MQLNNYNDDHNDNKWIYVEKHTTKHSKKHQQQQHFYPINLLTPDKIDHTDEEHRFIGFTSNHQNHSIIHACGYFQYDDIKKGSRKENRLWSIKDSFCRGGKHYYFDSPDQAELMLKIVYHIKDKQNWYFNNKIGNFISVSQKNE